MLDFRMYTFAEVCKYMNFTRAAESLNITQPTVSQHIRWLEEAYGTKLFDYVGKKMYLTDSGRQILSVATTMIHDEGFLKKTVSEAQSGWQTLCIGATLTIGESVIADHIAAFLRKNPKTRIHVEVANTKRLETLLNLGEMDFALVEGYFEKKDFDYETYSNEDYVCACGPKTYDRLNGGKGIKADMGISKDSLTISDLLAETLLIREEGSGTREILEKNLKDRNIIIDDFFNRIEISNINAIKRLVEAECGITFLYRKAIERELSEGRIKLLNVADFPLHHEFALIWRKGSVFAARYKNFFAED